MKKMTCRIFTIFILSLLAQMFPCLSHAAENSDTSAAVNAQIFVSISVNIDMSFEAYTQRLVSIFSPEYTVTSEISETDSSVSIFTISRVTPAPEKLKSLTFNLNVATNRVELQLDTIASVFTNDPGLGDIEINGPILYQCLGQLSGVTDPLAAMKSLEMKAKMDTEIRFSLNGAWRKISEQDGNIKIEKFIFTTFDGLYYTGKPDLSPLGLKPILIVSNFFKDPIPCLDPPTNSQIDLYSLQVDPVKVQNWANYAKNNKMSVFAMDDIITRSNWRYPDLANDAKVTELQTQIFDGLRALNPDLKNGIYGCPPRREYGAPFYYFNSLNLPGQPGLDRNKATYELWQTANDRLLPFMQTIDVAFPSIYTFYDNDPSNNNEILNWEYYALGNILEARRVAPGKPVYVFIWPQIHSNGRPNWTFPYMDLNLWKRELEVVRKYADGVVIWGSGSIQNEAWNENAPWWQETKTFLASLDRLIPGDVSGDDAISGYDAALAVQTTVRLIALTPDQAKAAEVSGDSEITGYDAALIAQKSVGLIDKFPVEAQ